MTDINFTQIESNGINMRLAHKALRFPRFSTSTGSDYRPKAARRRLDRPVG